MARLSFFLAAVGFAGLISAQCPNTIAQYNPNLRTQSMNNTWLIIPVPKAAVLKAVQESNPDPLLAPVLLDVPASELPGFQKGMHPVIVSGGQSADIRMAQFQIDGPLQQSSVYAAYVGINGSKTPLTAPISAYIAGTDMNLLKELAGVVPAAASTLFEGTTLRIGSYLPKDAAWQDNGAGIDSLDMKWYLVPNPVSGPGVYPEVADIAFKTTSKPKYTATQIKKVINQPIILQNALSGLCVRNTFYFNNATAFPALRNGNATLGPASSVGTTPYLQNASPDGYGYYYNVDGLSGCAQTLGSNPQECEEAARTVDPKSYQ